MQTLPDFDRAMGKVLKHAPAKGEAIVSRLLYMKKILFNLCVKKGDNNQIFLCTIICCLFQGRLVLSIIYIYDHVCLCIVHQVHQHQMSYNETGEETCSP